MDLAPCPCGEIPEALGIAPSGEGSKWAYVYGGCCGEWTVMFRTNYAALDSAECFGLAEEAWNAAQRGGDEH